MATEHCPPGGEKHETGSFNDVVLLEGTSFCVKGSTDATGKLTADGETTLFAYLNNDHDVSYYVIYPGQSTTTSTTAPPTTTTTAPVATTTTSRQSPPENPVSPPNTVPGTKCVTPGGHPYTTSYPECPEPIGTTEIQMPARSSEPMAELPRTGLSGMLLMLALFLVISGVVAVLLGKLIKEGTR